jgi:hypothetical protein
MTWQLTAAAKGECRTPHRLGLQRVGHAGVTVGGPFERMGAPNVDGNVDDLETAPERSLVSYS